jgi:hypothetical protein
MKNPIGYQLVIFIFLQNTDILFSFFFNNKDFYIRNECPFLHSFCVTYNIQSKDTSIRDFQYGSIRLQYMLITFLVITLKRQFG